MKHINTTLFVILFIFLCAFDIFAIPKPTEDLYVNDFANVLSEDVKSSIISRGKTLHDATSAELVVVTLNSLDGEAVEDYALNILRDWGIGDKNKNNGVLILLSVGDRKVKIEVGYGLEGAINDGKAGRILDTYGVSHFRENDWNTGINEVYISLLTEIYNEYGVEVPQELSEISKNRSYQKETNDIYFDIVIFILIFIIFIFFIKGGRNSTFIGGPFIGGPFSGPGGFGSGPRGGFGGGSSGGGGASRGF